MKIHLTIILFFLLLACKANCGVVSNCPACPPLSGIDDWLANLLDESERFGDRSSVFQMGIGFRSDINLAERAQELDQLDVEMVVPAMSLTYEKNIGNNIGLGITLAAQIWKVPVFNYQYRYYSGGLRATYHFNIHEKLDPYIGGALSYRRMSLTNQDQNTQNWKVTGSWLLGARYYLDDSLGGFMEVGNDALTWFKVGLTYYMP